MKVVKVNIIYKDGKRRVISMNDDDKIIEISFFASHRKEYQVSVSLNDGSKWVSFYPKKHIREIQYETGVIL